MNEKLTLVPPRTRLNAPFFDGANAGELRLQRCQACGNRWFPPSSMCPRCLSADTAWAAVSGRGRIWSWIVMYQRYFEAFRSELPYNVAYIQLEEGPFLVSRLVGCDPGSIACDLPVEVAFESIAADLHVPVFRLVQL